MTRFINLLAIWFSLGIPVFALAGAPSGERLEFHSLEQSANLVTALIGVKNGSQISPSGTGFVVEVPKRGSVPILMLCSASHVFTDSAQTQVAVFHRKLDGDDRFDFTDVVLVEIEKKPGLFYSKRDPNTDLACANLSNVAPGIFFRSLTPSDFATLQEPSLTPNTPVFFVGYPDGRIDHANYTPITRHGYLGSLPQLDFDGKPEFVVDAQVIPGSSGSPVFAKTGDRYKVVGIMTESMTRTYNKVPAGQSAPESYTEYIGLGLARKSTVVRDFVFESAALFSAENNAIPPAPLASDEARHRQNGQRQ